MDQLLLQNSLQLLDPLLSEADWRTKASLLAQAEAIWLVWPHFQHVGLLPITITGNIIPLVSNMLGMLSKLHSPSLTEDLTKLLNIRSQHLNFLLCRNLVDRQAGPSHTPVFSLEDEVFVY